MSERRLKAILSAEVLGYNRGMREAATETRKTKKAAEELGETVKETGSKSTQSSKQSADAAKQQAEAAKKAAQALQEQNQALTEIGTTTAALGAATLAGVGVAVKSYADFDKQMSAVRAATHETAGNMDLLRDAAVEAGADTAFSAAEAAQGIEELSKAGVSTKDILAGGLKGSLDLAAAGALGVGEASELAATAMTQFGLSGDKIPHIADLLAAAAGKAQGSVQDMGAALKQSGLVADQTGLTIEETTGGLAAFASAGLVGSDAGTSFKSMLQRLTPQSKEAATRMAELGISAYDSQGNFIGLSEFAGVLKDSMKDLTVEERNAAMATIFGSDAVRAASVIYENGAEGVQKWEDAVNDAGFAAETASMRQDNLAGDLEKLGGSLDSVFLKSGSGANEVLRDLVQGLEGTVDALGRTDPAVLQAGLSLAGLVGGAALLGGGLITVIPKIRDTRAALAVLAPAGSKADRAVRGAGRAAGLAAVGFAALAVAAEPIGKLANEGTKATGDQADALERFAGEAGKGAVAAGTLNSAFADLVAKKAGVDEFQTAIDEVTAPGGWTVLGDTITNLANIGTLGMLDLKSATGEARDRFSAMGEEIASLDAEGASAAFQSMAEQTDGSNESLTRLLDLLPAYRDSLEQQAVAASLATDDQTLLKIAMGELSPAVEEVDGALEEVDSTVRHYTDGAGQAIVVTEGMADRLEDVGLTADGAIVALDKYTEALFASGLAVMSSREASFAWEDTLRDMQGSIQEVLNTQGELGSAVNDTASDFNRMTDSGQAANEVFQGIITEGLGVASTFSGDVTKSLSDVQAQLVSTYDAGVRSAMGLGLSEEAAIALTREAMQIPEGVTIESWMSEEAKNMAQETTGAVIAVPDTVTIDSWMSEAAKLTADATKKSADDVPEQETIDSWMSDAAFMEALRTRAAALNIPEHEAISSFMSSAARNEADSTTAEILGIPKGASVSSFMSNYARVEAQNLKGALDAVDGRVVTSYMDVITRRSAIDLGAAPAGTVVRPGQVGRREHGGRIPRHAGGGRLPSTGPGTERTDGILGLSSITGAPVSWLDGGEWIVNSKSSDKHHNLIAAVNRDDPRLAYLPALAGGGSLARREYSSMSAAGVTAQAPNVHVTALVENPWTGEQVQAVVKQVSRVEAKSEINVQMRGAVSQRRGM